jgi:hypothetical protein
MGLIPGVLTYVAYKTEVCLDCYTGAAIAGPDTWRSTLTTYRANTNSVASARVTPSKSGKQLASNRKLELLFPFLSAPRTVPRPDVIWRGRQQLGILYRFCQLFSVPVPCSVGRVLYYKHIPHEFPCYVDFWPLVRIGLA